MRQHGWVGGCAGMYRVGMYRVCTMGMYRVGMYRVCVPWACTVWTCTSGRYRVCVHRGHIPKCVGVSCGWLNVFCGFEVWLYHRHVCSMHYMFVAGVCITCVCVCVWLCVCVCVAVCVAVWLCVCVAVCVFMCVAVRVWLLWLWLCV